MRQSWWAAEKYLTWKMLREENEMNMRQVLEIAKGKGAPGFGKVQSRNCYYCHWFCTDLKGWKCRKYDFSFGDVSDPQSALAHAIEFACADYEDNDNVCSTCGENPPFEYQGKLYKRCAECAWTAIVKFIGAPDSSDIYSNGFREILEI